VVQFLTSTGIRRGIFMRRGFMFCMLVTGALLLLVSCANKGAKTTQKGKVMSYPEVRLDGAGPSAAAALPEISEIRWDFFHEEGKDDLVCKFRMQVTFKQESKFMAKINFLDLNNFPVTTEKLKIMGKKDEQVVYEHKLYIDQKNSRRITKAQVVLTPIQ
jgi:hypothetical protein